MNHLHGVILAGGSGTRFWPMSRTAKPKQFLTLFGKRTLLQTTFDRLSPLIPADRWSVITNHSYTSLVSGQLPDLHTKHIVGESVARNTAPCIALAAALIYANDPEGVMVVLPSDHFIGDPHTFRNTIRDAADTAIRTNGLVTIGIRPNRPETGYGYIRLDAHSVSHQGSCVNAHPLIEFREKPDLKTALSFLDSGDYVWNSGMFIWKAATILDEVREHAPEIHRLLAPFLEQGVDTPDAQSNIDHFFQNAPSISIDYAVMEKARNVHVLPGDFGWNDVGSWTAVHELGEKDGQGNVTKGDNTLLISSSGNVVETMGTRLVTLIGMEGTAVVETEDVLMVCNLEHAQEVKKAVEQLQSKGEWKTYL